jgi:hypothetical protein
MSMWQEVILGMTLRQFIINIIYATILIIVGIVVGQIIKYILRRIVDRAEFKNTQRSFAFLFISIVKWGIYILFLNFALIQLDIPQFTDWLTNILVVIPALVGALLLIGVGFSIASYLKEVIEDSRISGWKALSQILFIFINYIFIAFAFKTALISLDQMIVNVLLLILTAAVAAGVAFWYAKK